MIRIAILAGCLVGCAFPALAGEPCDFDGYLAEAAPTAMVEVRAKPEATAPVIAVLPAKDPNDPDRSFAPSLTVTRIENGYAEVRHVVFGAYVLDEVQEAFAGPGWIPLGAVTSGFSAYPMLHAGPGKDFPVILQMQGEDWGADSVMIDAIRACKDGWIEVDVTTPDGRKAHGWGTAVCGNQATTCV